MLLIFAVGVAFVVVMARALQDQERSRTRAELLLEDLEVSHAKLRASSERVAELAAADERNRLARDIHDSLGHHLTAISIQLEKALAFRARSPDDADRAIEDARQSARAALTDVRRSVASLRGADDPFSLRSSLARLVDQVSDTRFSIDLLIDGDEVGFAQPALMTLYRAAQEGLTNVYRHAQEARQVSIHVSLDQAGAELCLGDDGRGFDPTFLAALPLGRADRYGLQGLRERVDLVGGRLRVESSPDPASRDHGTRLIVWVPRQLPVSSTINEPSSTGDDR